MNADGTNQVPMTTTNAASKKLSPGMAFHADMVVILFDYSGLAKMRRRIPCGATVFFAALLSACALDMGSPSTLPAPQIRASSVATDSGNTLSATVLVDAVNADSVLVRFHLATPTSASDSSTPPVKISGGAATVPVLALMPVSRYVIHVVAYGPGGTTVGSALDFTTGALPADLPRYSASGSDPSPGYTAFATGMYGVVIDNTGRVVWYHRFPNGPGLNFMAEPNGDYVVRPTFPTETINDSWFEIDPLGNTTRRFACALGLKSRPHDMIIDSDGGYWLMCDETRTMNLSDSGGVDGARVTGTSIQHIERSGKLLFSWSPFDHFSITDGEPADRKGPTVNWTHGNSIDVDTDGNLLISFRNLSEITKIDIKTGAVIWRLGGRRNQFTFVNSSSPAFMGQHSIRVAGPHQLAFLDNVGNPKESRARVFMIDETSMTATLSHDYGSLPGVVTQIGGSVQRLDEGRTLVSFGTAGRVEEYDASGRVVWRVDGNPGYVFRAQRIHSLYSPGVGTTR